MLWKAIDGDEDADDDVGVSNDEEEKEEDEEVVREKINKAKGKPKKWFSFWFHACPIVRSHLRIGIVVIESLELFISFSFFYNWWGVNIYV